MLKPDPSPGKVIEHRRVVGGSAVGTDALIPEIVCHDQDDVWSGRLALVTGQQRLETERREKKIYPSLRGFAGSG